MKRVLTLLAIFHAWTIAAQTQPPLDFVMALTNGAVAKPSNFWDANIGDVKSRIPELVPTNRLVATGGSVIGGGSLAADRTLSLSGDQPSPGASRYYGTDGSGTKGWFPLPEGVGDMLADTYDTDGDGVVDVAEAVSWLAVTGKPATFPPSSHTHSSTEISDGTATGRALLTAPSTGSARVVLELGDSATRNVGTAAGTVAAGNDARFLTSGQLTDLTDAGDSTSHFHASDRSRANHTGTQTRDTISDFAHASTHSPGASDPLPWATIHGIGTTAARPAASSANIGYLYANTDTGTLQRSNGSAWVDIATSGGGGFDEDGNYTLSAIWIFNGPVTLNGTNNVNILDVDELVLGTPLSIANGGFGGTTAAQARTNLELVPGTHVQEWNENLESLATISGVGFYTKISEGGTALNVLIPGDGISISNGDGVESSPIISTDLGGSINSGTPNGTGALVHWSQLTGVPSGLADGTDAVGAFTWDIDVQADTASNTTTPIHTNAVPDGYTHFLRAFVTGAGPTNRAAFTIDAVVGNVGGTGSGGTNQTVGMVTGGSMTAYWERVGATAVLRVRGPQNENVHWLAQATVHSTTNAAPEGGGGGQVFLVSEDFEGTGTPGGWTTSGTVDFDYTTSPISGSQSWYGATTSDYAYTTYTAAGEVWVRVRFRPDSLAANYDLLTLRDSSGSTIVARINIRTTGGFRVYQGAAFAATASGLVTAGQNCYLWLRYVPGTATDGISELYFSTDATRPASPTASVANGDATALPARVRLFGGPSVFDSLRVSETEIDPD